ncbi:MAG: FKBP-type peptidyl-prolyl cis-trans isomerase [Muribaculaceae bacterium]|nr:FKBP-type peptidyl-prolyl cis-trans isomerase [Muribaculaceae bacterium]
MKIFRAIAAVLFSAAIASGASAQTPQTAGPAVTDSVSTAVGTVLGENIVRSLQQLERMGVAADRQKVAETIVAYVAGVPTGLDPMQANIFIDNYIAANSRSVSDTVSVESQEGFLSNLAATDGAIRTPSGLVFIVEQEGEGPFPAPDDVVTVDYVGRFSDGTVFDRTEGRPVDFPIGAVVPGFAEGLQMMKPGGRYRIAFPASLGYGAQGIPGAIPGNAAIDFTVTLHSVKPAK